MNQSLISGKRYLILFNLKEWNTCSGAMSASRNSTGLKLSRHTREHTERLIIIVLSVQSDLPQRMLSGNTRNLIKSRLLCAKSTIVERNFTGKLTTSGISKINIILTGKRISSVPNVIWRSTECPIWMSISWVMSLQRKERCSVAPHQVAQGPSSISKVSFATLRIASYVKPTPMSIQSARTLTASPVILNHW